MPMKKPGAASCIARRGPGRDVPFGWQHFIMKSYEKFSPHHSQNAPFGASRCYAAPFAHIRALRSCIAEYTHSCGHDRLILRCMAELWTKKSPSPKTAPFTGTHIFQRRRSILRGTTLLRMCPPACCPGCFRPVVLPGRPLPRLPPVCPASERHIRTHSS